MPKKGVVGDGDPCHSQCRGTELALHPLLRVVLILLLLGWFSPTAVLKAQIPL